MNNLSTSYLVSGVRYLILLIGIIIATALSPSLATAFTPIGGDHSGFQPSNSNPVVRLGQTPVPNAGMRSHWDSIMTGPGWWRKRPYNQNGPQGPMQYPTNPY